MKPDTTLQKPDKRGMVIDSAADGWFHVCFFDTGWNPVQERVIPISELKTALFFDHRHELTQAAANINQQNEQTGLMFKKTEK